MPKILRVLNRLNVGGPTYNVAYLSKYINPKYQTKVLAGYKEPHEGSSEYMLQELDVPYEFVPNMYRSISPGNDIKALKFIMKSIKEYEPDIVHTHAAKAGVLGRLAAYFSNPRPKVILHTYHGNVFDGYFSPIKTKIFLAIERYLAAKSQAIIAISEKQKQDLAYVYKIAPAYKIHVVRLGFDLSKFGEDNNIKRQTFRAYYGITDDIIVITITGRLAPIKNHSLFIQSIKLLKGQAADLKFKAFVVGDGELMDEVVLEAQQAGLTVCKFGDANFEADVVFTSWRKDIDAINAGSDIVALTSLNEGTPVSIIEAQASERAVVCTDVGGVKDVIHDGVSGFISEQTAVDFSENLLRLLKDPALRQSMGVAGKEFALKNYSYQRLVKDIETLYAKFI